MDTILGFFQSLAVSTDAQSMLFVLTTGATVFLFALGVVLPRACDAGPGPAPAQRRWCRQCEAGGRVGRASPAAARARQPLPAAVEGQGTRQDGTAADVRRAALAERAAAVLRDQDRPRARAADRPYCRSRPGCRSGPPQKVVFLRDAGRVHRPGAAELRPRPHGRAAPEAAARRVPGCARPARRLRRGGPRPHGGDPARVGRAEVQPPRPRLGVRPRHGGNARRHRARGGAEVARGRAPASRTSAGS